MLPIAYIRTLSLTSYIHTLSLTLKLTLTLFRTGTLTSEQNHRANAIARLTSSTRFFLLDGQSDRFATEEKVSTLGRKFGHRWKSYGRTNFLLMVDFFSSTAKVIGLLPRRNFWRSGESLDPSGSHTAEQTFSRSLIFSPRRPKW